MRSDEKTYIPRILDPLLGDLLEELPALAIDGPKAVGKTVTASRFARTVFEVDRQGVRESLENEPSRLETSPKPLLIDEWQFYPDLWNQVRRLVDKGARPGSFLLAGSAYPARAALHSGAGRIVHVRMRPLSLAERWVDVRRVSLGACLSGSVGEISDETGLTAKDYIEEIVASGFPGIRPLSSKRRSYQLESYIENIVSKEVADSGMRVRKPDTLRRWLRAFAAASGTSASYTEILDAATPGESDKPAKKTMGTYRDALYNLWLLDEVPLWIPQEGSFSRLKQTPKHYLADPALAARLLGLDADMLLAGEAQTRFDKRYGTVVGRLFESLMGMSLQVYAQANGASLGYIRTLNGDHEIDFIVHKGHRAIAIEVKFSPVVNDSDVRHLKWFKERYKGKPCEAMVITTGERAYRRSQDGVLVIPAALLGP